MTQLPIAGPPGATLPWEGGGAVRAATRCSVGAAGGTAAVKPASGCALAAASRGVVSGMTRLGSKFTAV